MTDNDKSTEAMIQAAGKTAPRLTLDSIKAVITSEHYFTAAEGATGAAVTKVALAASGHIANHIFDDCHEDALHLLTFCVLVLRNGFTVTGKSACVSPENFDANIGRKVAFEDAFSQIWPLEGYLLKEKLAFVAIDGRPPRPPADNAHVAPGAEQFPGLPAHQQRVVTERDELAERIAKLSAFLATPTYQRLDDEEQTRLANQLEAMRLLCAILNQRIDAFKV